MAARSTQWRDWKSHFWWQLEPQSGKDAWGAVKLEIPYLFNLLTDPQEETDVRTVFGLPPRIGPPDD